MTRARQALGAHGEALAARWYEEHGYEVLARNWRCRDGELDLVVRRNRTIVFCEVKTRTTTAYGTPGEAVTHAKRQRIRRLAARWLEESPIRPSQIRFDVAAVLGGDLQVIEGAF
ncbi:MAG: YraN family protein [Acidimicrobiales bacterium]